MKISAILAALLALTVTAGAQPKRESLEPKRPEPTARVNLDENSKKKKKPKVVKVHRPGEWFEVGDATPAKYGSVFFGVGEHVNTVDKLRLDASKGRVVVRRVAVYFAGGGKQVFAINKVLDYKRAKSTVIDLGGVKTIEQIIMTTDANTTGEYEIWGSSGRTEQPTCC